MYAHVIVIDSIQVIALCNCISRRLSESANLVGGRVPEGWEDVKWLACIDGTSAFQADGELSFDWLSQLQVKRHVAVYCRRDVHPGLSERCAPRDAREAVETISKEERVDCNRVVVLRIMFCKNTTIWVSLLGKLDKQALRR